MPTAPAKRDSRSLPIFEAEPPLPVFYPAQRRPTRRAKIAGKLATFYGERKVSINIALPAFAITPGPSSPLRHPKFSNDDGSEEIYVAVKQFECIGASPPHDHPHIYLDMGKDETILCPYCATRFWFIPRLDTDRGRALIDGEGTSIKSSRADVRAALDSAMSEGWPVQRESAFAKARLQ